MPLTPTATRELLALLGHDPKRRLGQNFLVDGNIVRKSVELAGIGPDDAVVEIGPGLGTLTVALLDAGAEVWAIEIDPKLHAHLPGRIPETAKRRFHLTLGDAVRDPLAGLPPERASAGFKVVANLPYAVSTPWLDAVLSGPLPGRMVLMLQEEAAQRYLAEPGTKSFGAISIFLQAAYRPAASHRVSPACFHPEPEVDSTLVSLERKPEPEVLPAPARELIRKCFQHRRKQLGAIWRGALPPKAGSAGAPDPLASAEKVLREAGLGLRSRPEDVPVPLWLRLASVLVPR